VERRLAAILAADVVGYSRLMGIDETGTLAALKQHRSELVDAKIAEHQGRIFKLTGDGIFVEFPSVVNAVTCAAEIQRAMCERNASVQEDRRIELRMGVNLGDVIIEGDDIFGDGVNVAARLESVAQPGGVALSATVRDHIGNRLDLAFEDIGEHKLKNIERPVHVYHLRWGGTHRSRIEAPLLTLPTRPSIAVLPFDNLSGQADETYFSDGITEDIITGLARFRSLFVIARNSSFAFRGKSVDIAEIARKLGVAYILEGSVRKAGSRVRITGQLIDASNGAHLWADRYDRALDDIFAVQDEVAQTIVATLFGRIQEARVQRSAQMPTESLTAYDCLLRGLAHFRAYGENENERALEMFEKAVDLDPRYAVARSYRALARVTINGSSTAPVEVLNEAYLEARQAVELDPQESRCHRILSTICLYRREYDMAEQHVGQAFDLNPNDPDAVMQKGRLLAMRGRPEDALACLETAVRLNPFHPPWYNAHFGIAFYSLRRFEEAAQAFKRMVSPGAWSRARLAACHGQLERPDEARAVVAEVLRLQPDFSIEEYMRTSVLLERAEDRQLLREGLVKAGLPR
jgi:TolB-like protein/class 3 adenylate cyclase/lipoprotein NlpI